MATTLARTGRARVNGTELYYEVRGQGPALVLIAGGASSGRVYEKLADLLADTNTVVTYDRRGLSRSPKPRDWTSTTIEEQADDCAGLIAALGLDSPVVFGHSLGGTIIVSLLERHPNTASGAIVHEPGLSPIAPSAAEFAEQFLQLIQEASQGSPEEYIEAGGRFIMGDADFELADRELMADMSANVETNGLEIAAEASFQPNPQALAAAGVPIHAIYGRDTQHAWLVESATWVSEHSGGPLHVFPGAHGAWMGREQDFARRLLGIIASMGGGAS